MSQRGLATHRDGEITRATSTLHWILHLAGSAGGREAVPVVMEPERNLVGHFVAHAPVESSASPKKRVLPAQK